MSEKEYTSIGTVVRRSGNKYALVRVFLDEGKVVDEEVLEDHCTLPGAIQGAHLELDRQLLKLNRHVYEFPVYVTNSLKVG